MALFPRQKYKDFKKEDWKTLKNPVATNKYDGGNFHLIFSSSGTPSFLSRRESVKGDYPDRTEKLPHLSDIKVPELANHVYTVELIHTGNNKDAKESHPKLSGLLNSLKDKSIRDQAELGPVRAVLIDVINPSPSTYRDKLLHMKNVERLVNRPDVLFVPTPAIGVEDIHKLIAKTKAEKREGVIITDLDLPEDVNPRIKIKHKQTTNLVVGKVIQEKDKNGNLKNSMGALELMDATGRVVCKVGSGFEKPERAEIWQQREEWPGKIVQVESRGVHNVGGRLINPIYNGIGDGEIDTI